MKKEYESQISVNNIEDISRFNIWLIFRKENKEEKELYLKNTLSKWIDNFEGSDEALFSKVRKIIRKTKITLNDIERDSLFVLEERAFSEIRQIKAIDVNNQLYKGESVGVKFRNAKLYESNSLKLKYEGDLLISNKRIIFDGYPESFRFSAMSSYSNKKDGLEFITVNGKKYLIRIHDSKTLNNTFNNIIYRKVKNAIKKH